MSEILFNLQRALNYPLFKLGETEFTLTSLCVLVLMCALVIVLERVFRRHLIQRVLKRTRMEESMQYAISRIAGYLLLGIGFYIALQMIGIDLSSLALIAGGIGVGLGFGLQNVLSNFICGIIILFERSLKVGDFVQLESGVAGEVQAINMRFTLIHTNDNIDILVPNSEFVNGRVINWTHNEAYRRIHVPFGVAYGTDKELVRQAVLEAADRVPFTVRDQDARKPQVWFVGFGNSSLDFELIVWLGPDALKRPAAIQSAYLWEIHTSLYQHTIEIPFPQNDLHVRSFFGLKDADAKRWFEERVGKASARPPGAAPAAVSKEAREPMNPSP